MKATKNQIKSFLIRRSQNTSILRAYLKRQYDYYLTKAPPGYTIKDLYLHQNKRYQSLHTPITQ